MRAFIDIFHHRLLSLFYRCWLKYRYHVQFEPGGNDDFSRRIFGLIGIGTAGLTDNTGLPSVHLLRYAGFFSQQIRSAPALEGILSDFFEGIDVRVEPFTGRWAAIIPPQKSALGIRNCRLNTDCNIGDSVFSRSGSFRIIAGPLSFNTFVSFLPGRENFKTLVSLVKFFIRDRLMFDIKLLIRELDILRMQLISDSQIQRTQLGWTSWLFSERPEGPEERFLLLKGSS